MATGTVGRTSAMQGATNYFHYFKTQMTIVQHGLTITDGVFSQKEHDHNDATICKIKYMVKKL
jgi:hypothetical protein